MKSDLLTSYLFQKNVLIYYWLPWVSVAVCGLSLGVVNGGYSLAAVCRLLLAVVSLVAEHRL